MCAGGFLLGKKQRKCYNSVIEPVIIGIIIEKGIKKNRKSKEREQECIRNWNRLLQR